MPRAAGVGATINSRPHRTIVSPMGFLDWFWEIGNLNEHIRFPTQGCQTQSSNPFDQTERKNGG